MGFRRCELSVTLTGDDAMRSLNRDWRGKDRPTDVLSFSQVEGPALRGLLDGPCPVLGDVVISLDTAQRQAAAHGHDLANEVTRLLIHGVLHLLGHDHVHGGHQARKMKHEEARLGRLCG